MKLTYSLFIVFFLIGCQKKEVTPTCTSPLLGDYQWQLSYDLNNNSYVSNPDQLIGIRFYEDCHFQLFRNHVPAASGSIPYSGINYSGLYVFSKMIDGETIEFRYVNGEFLSYDYPHAGYKNKFVKVN